MARITLTEWNLQYFAKPRRPRTLYLYIQNGKIFPAPIKVGRDYEVEESAILLDGNSISNTSVLMERINGKKAEQRKRGAAT